MDHPYNHQSRYVSIPSPNPNLYGGQIYQHNHLQPPPPPPPQPPSVPLLQLPPPPPPTVTPRAPIQQQFHLHRFPPQSLTQTKYNSHHAQFALDPNPNLNCDNQNREHHQQQALELSRRIPVDDDRRHHHHHHHQHHQHHRLLPEFEVRTESWNPGRIMTDHRSTVTNFERHHQPDQRPVSPYRCTDKARHEVVTNYRYRERYGNDVLESEYGNGNNKQRAEFVQRRNHIISDSDRSNSVTSGPLYTSHFDTNELTRSNVRDRLLDRQPLRDREVHDSLPELGSNNENGGDRVRFFNGKLEFYGSDSGRYGNNKGSRDNSYEHNRTPRKQVQKKSALLRIQKPYHRNRDNNQLHYPGYFDESKGGSFRGKDQLVYSDGGVDDSEVRKGSSVELDVSFKSNSLVAAVVSDTNLTPKSGKIRKIEVSDKDWSSSQMNKVHNDNIKLDSSRNMGNNAFCSSNKESQRFEKKVANSVTAYTHEDNPLPLFATDDSLNKNSAERLKSIVLSKDSTSATSKKSFPTKKKKIFTKVVKKHPNLHLSSQPPEKPVEPFKADDSTLDAPAASGLEKGVKSSEEKCAPADMSSENVVDSHPSNETFPNSNKNKEDGSQQAAMVSKEVITDVGSARSSVTKKSLPLKKKRVVRKAVLKANSGLNKKPINAGDSTSDALSAPENGMKSLKVEHAPGGTYSANVDLHTVNEVTNFGYNDIEGESLQAVVAEETSPNLDSGGSCVTKSKRKRNASIPPLASSSSREVNDGENSKNADNSLCIINTIKKIPESLNVTTISDDGGAEGDTKRFSYNEDSSLFENSVRNYSSDVSYPVREISSSDQLSLEGKKEHGVHVIAGSFSHGLNTAGGFAFDLIGSQEKITDSDYGTVDCFSKESCEVDINALDNATTVEEHPSVILPARSSEFSALSSSEGTGILSVSVQADCSNHEPGGIPGSDIADINLKKSHNSGDNSSKQLSTNGVFISRKNGASVGILNTMVSERGTETDMYVTTNKNEVTKSLFDLSSANTNDVQVVSAKPVSSTEYVDTTLSTSPQDISPSEVYVPGSLDVGLQSCTDGLCSISGNSEAKVSIMSDFAGTSPEKSKRRKISDSHGGFTMPTTHPVKEVLISDMDTICTTSVPFCPEGIPVLHANSSDELLSNVVSVSQDSDRNMVDGLESKHPRVDSFSGHKQSDGSKAPSCCPIESGGELIANTVKIMDENNLIEEVLCEKRSKEERVDAVAAEKQIIECSEITKHKAPSENHSQDLSQRLPGTDVDSACYSLEKDDLPLISAYVSPSAANDDEVSTTNSRDQMMKHNILSDMGSPEIVSSFPVTQRLNSKASTRQISNEEVSRTDKMQTDQPLIDGSYDIRAPASSSEYTKRNLQSDDGFESAHLVVSRTGPLISQDATCIAQNSNSVGEVHRNKNQQNFAVSRTHPSHSSSLFTVSKSNSAASRVSKPRTWHRKDSSASTSGNRPFSSSVSSQSQLMKWEAKFESMSYIRKGNSLVRRAASIAALPQVPHDVTLSMNQLNSGELKKVTVSNNKVDAIDSVASLKAGGTNALIERPRTPPLPCVNKMGDHSTSSSSDRTCSLLPEPLPSGGSENTSGYQKSLENIDVHSLSNDASEILETPVNRAGLVNSLECQGQMNDGTSATSVVKRLTYLKRKANQLVAASTNSSLSAQSADKSQSSVSDGYYKRRKNQLIRSSFESQKNQALTLSGDTSALEGRTALKKINKSSTNRRSSRAITKICKPSRFSLVWTLSGTQSSKKENHSSYCNEILPCLFPWKRASYRKSAVQTSASISNNSSISSIGRKLLLLRKRDMIYTRSNRGFSLRKSKVLSVGGCSLKWSKSIERHSKKASKEATMAVAAVGMKKREEGGAKSCPSGTKSKTNSSRERIFRIGSVRYKMDSSGRTLQRISDSETPCSVAVNSVKSGKQLYIPRRLLIGNDEYVRIGNGNQLVRDPKKRTRILASEKVRWSLHTARMRLARKRKYCQFFTRFGKCNKGDGKCPYIHDSSKIAVCTKFLNGLCSSSNCKLTHKVIPERMPDCSYFLQGLCTNKNCPYRHVHVNPNASTCEGFLKGYCADGNECRKKHSYVCPSFEATGSCFLGSKCKLHHPKSRSKTKKRKRSSEKNTRGRYFGTMHTDDSVLRITLLETSTTENVTDTTTEGSYMDYISLDSSDGEGETNVGINEQTVYDSDASDLQFDDLDEMIKPIRLMESMRT